MARKEKYYILLVMLLGVASYCYCQDTVKRQVLKAVEVTGQAAPSETYTSVPTEVVTIEQMERQGAVQLSDAVKQMNGVTVKDYGGVGGIKTMSARGLGSQFTGLLIDGVAVSDCQNGQIDLGRYMVGNSGWVAFANGQMDESLQSARALAAGNVLSLETKVPEWKEGEWWRVKAAMEVGSFGTYNPSVTWAQRIGEKVSYTLWANYLRSEGNYEYRLKLGEDSSVVRKRENSAMWMATGEGNIFWKIKSGHEMSGKLHYMQSYHQLPGPVIFYTTKNSEHSEERLAFGQAKYNYSGNNVKVQVLAKYQLTTDAYEDTAASNATGYQWNEYLQQEGYLSGTAVWSPVEGLKLSLATDGSVNSLASNLEKNNRVVRGTSQSVLAVSYDNPWVSVSANCLATVAGEQARSEGTDEGLRHTYKRLSPYAGVNVKPWRKAGLRFRYFFKENYRVPNFNEMYYYINIQELRPEKAMQHNAGITWVENWGKTSGGESRVRVQAVADAYYNRVSDKLIAVPIQNMFLWSMINLGRVDITGVDSRVELTVRGERWSLTVGGNYAYQNAVDLTDKNSKCYGHQIQYTPRNSGGASLYVETPWVEIGSTAMVVGERYYNKQNVAEYRLDPYCDWGLTVAKTWVLRNDSKLRVKGQVMNLLNVHYEVVRSYPMMGRNYRLGISWEL